MTGVPAGAVAVYPAAIPAAAPSYMFAVAVGNYTYHEIGVTAAGTHVGVYTLPGDTQGVTATASLLVPPSVPRSTIPSACVQENACHRASPESELEPTTCPESFRA